MLKLLFKTIILNRKSPSIISQTNRALHSEGSACLWYPRWDDVFASQIRRPAPPLSVGLDRSLLDSPPDCLPSPSRPLRVRFPSIISQTNRALHSEGSACLWYPRWESNPQLRFRRALVYPFTYGDLFISRILAYHVLAKVSRGFLCRIMRKQCCATYS